MIFYIPAEQTEPVRHLILLFTFAESEKTKDSMEYHLPYFTTSFARRPSRWLSTPLFTG
ncbi:hypothetical protein AAUPMB_04918 [Pasteurella multocida subsp. multocida str. Anand1_buffalo]|nr:hypothetical protein AAUPMB_04918 [Pasteurella multocida subsp. multocida str. Anand1_buffalo]